MILDNLFSKRQGYVKARDAIQFEGLDDSTKNILWSAIYEFFWKKSLVDPNLEKIRKNFLTFFWINILKKTTDTIPHIPKDQIKIIKKTFLEAEWFIIFDIIEIIFYLLSKEFIFKQYAQKLKKIFNDIFEKEKVGYRIINNIVVPITDNIELEAIDSALEKAVDPVKEHLNQALKLLSDRQNPDYRNSIKECILAIEAIVKVKLQNDKGTLGQLIKRLNLHPALEDALSKLYGYTSDAGGIRHAKLNMENPDFNDAKFFLVITSAFINYIQAKNNLE